MTRSFRKMHGLGNDFLVLDLRDGAPAPSASLARALADRRRGVGFDQLVALGRGRDGAAASVVFLNADGSRSAACGNGARCAAALLMDESGADRVALDTDAGRLSAWREPDGRVTVDMGPPRFDWREIPLAREVDVDALPLPGAPSAVSMGNPHCVVFCADADAAPVETRGPALERDALFPQRANVEFVSLAGPDALRARVWERGVGVTEACGSGACAAAVAAMRRGLVGPRVAVRLDGGTLDIAWTPGSGVLMTGPTATVYEGALAPDLLRAAEASP